jgi:DNA-binding MarR family transcriptional regulator
MSKIPQSYGTDRLYYRAEIHFIEFIGGHPGSNIKEISEAFGVSKATASKLLKKLDKKGAIVKTCGSDKRDTLITLTEIGQEAFLGHIKYHEEKQNEDLSLFSELSDEGKTAILQYLQYTLDVFETFR